MEEKFPEGEFKFPPIQRLMKRLGLRTVRRRGQHFLRHPEIGEKIVDSAEVRPEDVVVEIGAGLGNLSVPLAKRARCVHAVEPDRRFEPWHTHLQFFFKNLTFHYINFLEAPVQDWLEEEDSAVAVGNLPYYLTSPILFSLLEGPVRWRRIVVMVQKEVADRMITRPGSRTYGALSLKVQYFAVPRILFQVPSAAFVPPPQVKSCVIALDPRPDPLEGDLERRRRVFALIEQAFQHRRKTLPNALGHGGWWTLPRGELHELMPRLGINPHCRPETLSLEDFCRLEVALHGFVTQGEGKNT